MHASHEQGMHRRREVKVLCQRNERDALLFSRYTSAFNVARCNVLLQSGKRAKENRGETWYHKIQMARPKDIAADKKERKKEELYLLQSNGTLD